MICRGIPYTSPMPFPKLISLPNPLALSTVERARHWWHRLAPHRQDRVAVLAPLAAVALFFAAIIAALGYLRLEEIDREQQAVQRDVEYTHQRLRLRLLERQEQLMRIAREVSNRELDAEDFKSRARSMLNQYPELQGLAWIDERRRVKSAIGTAVLVASQLSTGPDTAPRNDTMAGFMVARESQQPVYIQPLGTPNDTPFLQMHLPLNERGRFSGVLLAEYSVDGLYRYGVPTEVTSRYAMSLEDAQGTLLAGTSIPTQQTVKNLLPWAHPTNEYAMPVSPVGSTLVVRGQAYRASLGVIGSGLFWLVSALSVMTAWMLIANWRHTRRRVQAQQALMSETTFRRAMENSMLTGMRAMDLQGRITYVNAAFCQMTGWAESDLVGRTAPFPYWPENDRDQLHSLLGEELSGKTTPGGIQVRVKRRDNTLFDARLYASPHIDVAR